MNIAAYPTYDSYSDSGVEWLGKIPSHWHVKRAGFLLNELNARSKDGTEPLLSLSKTLGVIRRDSMAERGGQAESLIGYKKVSENDIVINRMQAANGLVAVSRISGITSPDYAIYETKSDAEIRSDIAATLFQQPEYQGEIRRRVKGVMEGFIRLYSDDLFKLPLICAPLPEQRAIAAFLDGKCAKIDEAVRIKEAQIKLLSERRQILIQEAVTRGLNPDAPMKDSGIDWIGQIPAHWEVRNFRYLINVLTDFTANGSFADLARNVTYLDLPNFSRLIRLTDLRKGMENDGVYLSHASHIYLKKSELFGGELLMANVGAYAGFACVMPTTGYPASLGPNMFMMRLNDETSVEYVTQLLNSPSYWGFLQSAAQASAQPKLNKENVRSIRMLCPPKEEQTAIVEHIERVGQKINAGILIKEDQIATLKEYKTSLINAAVTGKVKVI